MQLWLSEADAFGLSENTRKGLLFCLGFELCIAPLESDQKAIIALAQKLSTHVNDPSYDFGGDFYDGPIAELLAEVGHKMDKDFKQRIVFTSSDGEMIYSYGGVTTGSQLPDISTEHLTLAKWERFLTVLYQKIGTHIHADAEGAYLAGFHFARSYLPMDQSSTSKIRTILSITRPPHLHWFRVVLHQNPDEVAPRQVMVKVMQMFLRGSEEKLGLAVDLCMQINELLHFNKDGTEDDLIGSLPLGDFINQLGHFQIEASAAKQMSFFGKRGLKKGGFLKPPVCKSQVEVLSWLESTVRRIWDYTLFTQDDLNLGEKATRKACATLAFTVAGLMRPNWNKVLYENVSYAPRD